MSPTYLQALGMYGQRRPQTRPQFSMGQFSPQGAQPKPPMGQQVHHGGQPTPGLRPVTQGFQGNQMQPIRIGNDPVSQQRMQMLLSQGYQQGQDGLLYPPGSMPHPYSPLYGIR